jgi:hypothetical protein
MQSDSPQGACRRHLRKSKAQAETRISKKHQTADESESGLMLLIKEDYALRRLEKARIWGDKWLE